MSKTKTNKEVVNMKQFIEFTTKDGGPVVFEVELSSAGNGGMAPAGLKTEFIEKAEASFEDAIAILKPLAVGVISTLKDLYIPPNDVELSVGLTASTKAGFVVASADAGVNLKVTLKWNGTEKK